MKNLKKNIKKMAKNILPYYFIKKYLPDNNRPYHAYKDHAPGEFYSPVPAKEEIEKYNFNVPFPESLPGIDLNVQEQMNLLNSFERFYNELPFTDEKKEGLRYYYKNGWYEYSDAIILHCMLRSLKPQKIIEVGSGFSSSLTLDTNEFFLENSMKCIFIEPFTERLESLLTESDKKNVSIHKKRLQEIPLEVFKELKENDILFIDSTHVSKFNSDVNYVIHKILPALAPGVYIHFHDIFYPFEYPQDWLLKGWAWNEQYILRAFLQFNSEFKIVMFSSFLENLYEEEIKRRFPLLYKVTGASIWLKRIKV